MENFKQAMAAVALLWSCWVMAAEDSSERKVTDSFQGLEDPGAVLMLAARYEHAEGVSRDYSKAAELYCILAKTGNARALYSLGWMYANGRGMERDDGVAALLFQRAAEGGHEHAQAMLQYVRSSPGAVLPACLTPPPMVETETKTEPETEISKAFPRGRIFDLVTKLAPHYEIDPGLALAVISVESGFNAKAVSPKNAQGLMQLLPETAQRFRVKDAFDPEENIKGGLAYLRWLLAYFKGNVVFVAAAYNAGERTVENYRGIPPYPETKNYVRKITALYGKAVHPYQANVVNASSLMKNFPH